MPMYEFLSATQVAAEREWGDRVTNLVIDYLKDNAREMGLVPKSFSTYNWPERSALRSLLFEFGWDV